MFDDGNWADKIWRQDPEVYEDLRKQWDHYGISQRNQLQKGRHLDRLIQEIRNKCCHTIEDMKPVVRAKYPNINYRSSYFTKKFPALVITLYLECVHLRKDEQFRKYYD